MHAYKHRNRRFQRMPIHHTVIHITQTIFIYLFVKSFSKPTTNTSNQHNSFVTNVLKQFAYRLLSTEQLQLSVAKFLLNKLIVNTRKKVVSYKIMLRQQMKYFVYLPTNCYEIIGVYKQHTFKRYTLFHYINKV